MTPTQRNRLSAFFALAFVSVFGFLIFAMYVDSLRKDSEVTSVETVEDYPFNEMVWYGFYKCEVNRIYYNLQFSKTMDAVDAEQEKAWTSLRNIYRDCKDNPNVNQQLLDELYLDMWRLEHKEKREPNMNLLHAAQSAANESCPLLWHKDS